MITALYKKSFVILIFCIIAFSIYSTSISSSFHFDDFHNFVNNPDTRISELSFTNLKKAAFTDVLAGFRPVAYLSFALNYYFSGENTTAYHVVNIILHALSAFLIYLIILKLFDWDNADDEKKKYIVISAFFTALIWLVTPFNSQAVIYLVQRMTLLMTFFFLLSFLYYIRGRKEGDTKSFILSGIFFLLSFLSKQNAVVFPLVIILYELIFVRKGDIKNISKNEKMTALALIVIMMLPLILFWDDISVQFKDVGRGWGFTYYERVLTQFRVLVFYLSLMVLPLPGRLSITHDIVKSVSIFSPITTIFSIIFILGLLVLSILRIKKSPYLSFALLWFFITMSVEAIVPVELMYEHRMHLPSIFLVGALVDFVINKSHKRNMTAMTSALVVVSIVLCAFTAIRGKVWETELTLWGDVISKYPEGARTQSNLGTAYFKIGMYKEAEHYLKSGVDNWSKVEADPRNIAAAYNNLGSSQSKLGKLDEAEISLLKGIKVKDDWAILHSNLGEVYFKKRDYRKALASFKRAANLEPSNSSRFLNMGSAYYLLKDYDKALESYKRSLELNPSNSNAHNSIGAVYRDISEYGKAIEHFNKALYLNPNNARAKKNLEYVKGLINKQ